MWTTQGRCPHTHRPNNNRNQLQFDEFEKRPNGPEGSKPTWLQGRPTNPLHQLYAVPENHSHHGLGGVGVVPYTEAAMKANGFGIGLLATLVRAGLAVATPGVVQVGGRTFGVVRLAITEAGTEMVGR
jgi:hypothetical protein